MLLMQQKAVPHQVQYCIHTLNGIKFLTGVNFYGKRRSDVKLKVIIG